MALNVAKLVAELERMTVTELRGKYAEVHGEPSRSGNRQYLIRRIAWRVQALEYGDLSERARQRALEIANDADLRTRAPSQAAPPPLARIGAAPSAAGQIARTDRRLPMPGALITREYRGRTINVRVLPQGFEYEGEVYKSLSAIAKAITGSHWNGYGFFHLVKPPKTARVSA